MDTCDICGKNIIDSEGNTLAYPTGPEDDKEFSSHVFSILNVDWKSGELAEESSLFLHMDCYYTLKKEIGIVGAVARKRKHHHEIRRSYARRNGRQN